MGILIWAHEKKNSETEDHNCKENYNRYYGYYQNKHAVSNVIRDISRTRENEVYGYQLICYGALGCGVNISAEDMIQEFLCIQNMYNIERRKKRRMYHEIFSLMDEEVAALNYNMSILNNFAMECAKWYFEQGHQVVYAIHHQSKFHIHFAVNSINYWTGKKFHTSKSEKAMREELFNQLLYKYMTMPKVPITPVQFYSDYTVDNEKGQLP